MTVSFQFLLSENLLLMFPNMHKISKMYVLLTFIYDALFKLHAKF